MKHAPNHRLRRVLGLALAVAHLVGCGGSGGGSAPPPPAAAPSPGPSPTPTPLPAPAPTACIRSTKTLYVDASRGDDSVSYAANSATTPWRSLGRAVWGSATRSTPDATQAVQPGDTVYVAAGTYDAQSSSGRRYDPAYNPANSGTAECPITLRATGRAVLQSTQADGPVAGSYERHHLVWDGFTIDENQVRSIADTGPVVLMGARNVTVQNFEIAGNTAGWTDNHNAIRIEYANEVLVRNNLIHGTRTYGGRDHQNGSAIMLYDSNDVVIERNTIRDASGGVFVKGAHTGNTQERITIRHNLLQRLPSGAINFLGLTSGGAQAYQNVIEDSAFGIKLTSFGDASNPVPLNATVVNNTIIGGDSAIWFANGAAATPLWRNFQFKNNLVVGVGTAANASESVELGDVDFRHNLYFNVTTIARVNYQPYTLDTWRSIFGQDAGTPATRIADPIFENATAADYRLRSGSPARNAGVDVLDLNANGSTTDTQHLGAFLSGSEVIGYRAP